MGVRLKVIVLAADLGSTQLVQYSTQSKDFTPNQWGTPGLLEINNFNVPKNAPLVVEVIVQSLQCTDSTNGYSSSAGGKPEYFDKIEIGGKNSAPTFYSEFVLKLKGCNCCS